MKALIFFDINGTLIKRDSRTDLPFQRAIDSLLHIADAMAGVDTSARSDKDVFMEVLRNHHLDFSEAKWEDFMKLYLHQLDIFKSTDVWRENADAVSFVNRLARTEHMLSLITGELSIGAEYKLEKIGVWQYFKTGGFGEDGLKRYDIAEAALSKAKLVFGSSYDEMFIIGDTILDIKTARHLGAKVISITTGSNTRDELAAEKPDHIIDCFSEIEHLFL